ncbi:MAG: murein transglycosylase [Bdellovibrionaceae bacterium]|nr:murein transglycosylase [Pseudobdellovibrionaceae bacterium]
MIHTPQTLIMTEKTQGAGAKKMKHKFKVLVSSFVFCIGCSQAAGSGQAISVSQDQMLEVPEDILSGDPKELSPTIYYRPTIDSDTLSCETEDVVEVVDLNDRVLTKLCREDYRNCVLQGTCLLTGKGGDRLLQYHREFNGRQRFAFADQRRCPMGYGVKNICLDPWFSVAADLAYYKTGDVIFVPAVRGIRLPDGRIHDGYFVIRDAGWGVKGENRFDFYTGPMHWKDQRNVFTKIGLSNPEKKFFFVLVKGELAEKFKALRRYPNLP